MNIIESSILYQSKELESLSTQIVSPHSIADSPHRRSLLKDYYTKDPITTTNATNIADVGDAPPGLTSDTASTKKSKLPTLDNMDAHYIDFNDQDPKNENRRHSNY